MTKINSFKRYTCIILGGSEEGGIIMPIIFYFEKNCHQAGFLVCQCDLSNSLNTTTNSLAVCLGAKVLET
jgi:hypothetical protein